MSKTINYSDLLESAKSRKISRSEIDEVAKKISEISKEDSRLLYTLIHILGRAEAIKYKKLIEPFLYYPSNPNIAKITLQSLCTYWDLTAEYLDDVKMFIQGVEWDDLDDVRIVAISIAGEFLRKTPNKELLALLVDVFEGNNDEIKPAENAALIQSCAYSAIARAMGKDYNQIPGSAFIEKQLQKGTLDLSIIQQAKQLI